MALFMAAMRGSNNIGSVIREMALKMNISVSKAPGAASVKCPRFNMFYLTTSTPDSIVNSSDPGVFGVHPEKVKLIKELGKHFHLERRDFWSKFAKLRGKQVYKVRVLVDGDKDAKFVFKHVMEEVECALGFIRSSECNPCNFYAMLDEPEANRLRDVQGVSYVTPLHHIFVTC